MSVIKDNALLVRIYDDLKELLSKKTKIPENLINPDDTLTGDLGFSKLGLRAFADDINQAFSSFNLKLAPGKVAACNKVTDLAIAIFDAIP
jgi:hypothetical protein